MKIGIMACFFISIRTNVIVYLFPGASPEALAFFASLPLQCQEMLSVFHIRLDSHHLRVTFRKKLLLDHGHLVAQVNISQHPSVLVVGIQVVFQVNVLPFYELFQVFRCLFALVRVLLPGVRRSDGFRRIDPCVSFENREVRYYDVVLDGKDNTFVSDMLNYKFSIDNGETDYSDIYNKDNLALWVYGITKVFNITLDN